jgi:putative Holliday junction resolvase
MIMLAVDFGDARTGLATCDKFEMLASPAGTLKEKNFNTCAQKTSNLAKKIGAELIVVGYPKNMNGTIGERAQKCEKFAALVTKLSGIDHVMWDERSTTVSAINYMNMTNTRGAKRKEELDQAAAVIILESYMQYRKNMQEKENG